MDRQLRSSLTIAEIRILLYRDAGSSTPDAETDAVLSSPLLTLTRGRAGFTHELFGRFLTAEQLALDTGDIAAVAGAIRDPRHADLLVHAVALVHDLSRRDLLLSVADPGLLSEAVRGRCGNETASVPVVDLAVVDYLHSRIQAVRRADPGLPVRLRGRSR